MNELDRTSAAQAPTHTRGSGIVLVLALALVLESGALAFALRGHPSGIADATGPPREAHPESSRVASVLKLEPFVVNLADVDRHRYVKATLHLGLGVADAAEQLNNDPVLLPPLRQAVIEALASRKADDVVTAAGKALFREELRQRLNRLPLPTEVVEVYITDLLVQF